jgi:hypothetical protein
LFGCRWLMSAYARGRKVKKEKGRAKCDSRPPAGRRCEPSFVPTPSVSPMDGQREKPLLPGIADRQLLSDWTWVVDMRSSYHTHVVGGGWVLGGRGLPCTKIVMVGEASHLRRARRGQRSP